MTVIAWDGKTLAADKQMMSGYLRSPIVTKIHRGFSGELLAFSGNASIAGELHEWYKSGCKPEDWPKNNCDKNDSSHLIVINKETGIRKYESGPYPVHLENSYMAFGCGYEAAMAVLYMGFPSVKAVEVASALISGCGNGVDTLEF
jgi:hypothetical protein